METCKVIVIGAGAAGLMAAGEASRNGCKVTLLEKMEKCGRKIRITGKGRCNLTNIAPLNDFLSNIYPNNGRFLRQSFSNFFSQDLINFFEKLGVRTTTQRGGRVFPISEKAADIAEALLKWNLNNKVTVKYNSQVLKLIIKDNKIKGVKYKNKLTNETETAFANAVIITTGGASYPATGSNGDGYKLAKQAGHLIITPRPALVPLETKGETAKQLQGLSLKNVNASLFVNNKKQANQFGEMLFTHFGVSGPIILSLSRFAVPSLDNNKQVTLSIDLKPALDYQKLDTRLLREIDLHGSRQVKALLKQLLPSKMVPVFVNILKIDMDKPSHQISSKERKNIRNLLKNFTLEISSYRSFKEAIVTMGGVSTKEVNPKTMESRLIKNLYFAGEVLDIDGKTGGYNLQIAFSTGILAGKSAAKKS
jgi:predicted Rossmann fold flavoprotein